MSIGRDAIGVALLGSSSLYAVGGFDGNQYSNVVEKYDTETNEWQQVSSMNFNRAGAGVVAVPNYVPAASTTV